jgi:hypothetical protein
VPIHKWPICPISVLREKFYPRNINQMPAVKFFMRLDLDQICEGAKWCPSISVMQDKENVSNANLGWPDLGQHEIQHLTGQCKLSTCQGRPALAIIAAMKC